MTNDLLLPAVAFLYTAVVSIPVALLTVVLSEFTETVAEALGYMLGGVGGVTLLGVVALGAVEGPGVALAVLATALAAVVVLTALPIGLGVAVVSGIGGQDRDGALRDALVGWPVGLAVALGILASRNWAGAEPLPTLADLSPAPLAGAVLAVYLAPPAVGLGIALIRHGMGGSGAE